MIPFFLVGMCQQDCQKFSHNLAKLMRNKLKMNEFGFRNAECWTMSVCETFDLIVWKLSNKTIQRIWNRFEHSEKKIYSILNCRKLISSDSCFSTNTNLLPSKILAFVSPFIFQNENVKFNHFDGIFSKKNSFCFSWLE